VGGRRGRLSSSLLGIPRERDEDKLRGERFQSVRGECAILKLYVILRFIRSVVALVRMLSTKP